MPASGRLLRRRRAGVATVALFAVGCADPLRVTHVSPTGTLGALPEAVEIQLDQPIIDPAVLGARPDDLDLTVSPRVRGEVRFPTPSSLAYHFTEPLRLAQTYEVRLDSGLRSADGEAVLARRLRVSFTTPVNRVEALTALPPGASGARPGLRNLDLHDTLVAQLAYPARAEELRRLVSIEVVPLAGGDAEDAAVAIDTGTEATTTRFSITPQPAWPAHARIIVSLGPGLHVEVPGAGAEVARETQVLVAETYGPLAVVRGPECHGCRPPPSLVIELSTPVDCGRVLPFVRIAPFHELRCAPAPGETSLRLEPATPLLQFTTYELRIRAGAPDRFGQVLPAAVDLAFETGDPSSHLGVRPLFTLVPRGGDANVSETVIGGTTLEVTGVRATFAEAWSLLRQGGVARQLVGRELWERARASLALQGEDGCRWDDGAGREVCAETSGAPGELAEELELPGGTKESFDVPLDVPESTIAVPLAPYAASGAGLVVLTARVLDGQGRRLGAPVLRLVNLTGLGVLAKVAPGQLLVFVTRLADGAPVPGAEVQVARVDDEGALAEAARAVTDESGVAVVPAGAIRGADIRSLHALDLAILARTPGDEALLTTSFVEAGQGAVASGTRLVGVVLVDARAHAPGDTLRFAVIARKAAAGALLPTAGLALPVRLVPASGGAPVHSGEVVLDERGSAAGAIPLPHAIPRGRYLLRVGDGLEAAVTVTTPASKLVRARLAVALEPGKPGKATVFGDYVFGAPAAGLPVSWWAWSEPAPRFASKTFADAVFGGVAAPVAAVAEGKGRLDSAGELTIGVPLADGGPALRRLVVAATIDDLSGAGASARAVAPLAPLLHLGIATGPEPLELGAPAPVSVVAVTPEDTPVSGASVALYAREAGADERLVCSGATDATGVLRCALEPQHEGEVSLRGVGGTPGATATAVTTLRAGAAARLHLRAEPDPMDPKLLGVSLSAPLEGGAALLTLEREELIWHRVAFTPELRQQVPLPSAWAPGAKLRAVALGRAPDSGATAAKLEAALELPIATPPGYRLDVQVTTDRATYAPGQPVKTTVQVRDAGGEPVAAQVLLRAVEETGSHEPDVLAAMFPPGEHTVVDLDARRYLAGARPPAPAAKAPGSPVAWLPPVAAAGAPGAPALWAVLDSGDAGRVTQTFTAPGTAGRYRIIASAARAGEGFGTGAVDLAVESALVTRPVWPAFLRTGDEAQPGVTVENRSGRSEEATVTLEGVDEARLVLGGSRTQKSSVPAGGTATFRWPLAVRGGPGPARLGVSVRLGSHRERLGIELEVLAAPGPLPVSAGGVVGPGAESRRTKPAAGSAELVLSALPLATLPARVEELAVPVEDLERATAQVLGALAAEQLGGTVRLPHLAPALEGDRLRALARRAPRHRCADGGYGAVPGCALGSVRGLHEALARLAGDLRARDVALEVRAPARPLAEPPAWDSSLVRAAAVVSTAARSTPVDPELARRVRELTELDVKRKRRSHWELAALVEALAAAVPKLPRPAGGALATVTVDGKPLRERKAVPAGLERLPLPRGATKLVLQNPGTEPLYYDLVVRDALPPAAVRPTVRRSYTTLAGKPLGAAGVVSGELVRVELTVDASGGGQGVLEEPLVPGLAPLDEAPVVEGLAALGGGVAQLLPGRLRVQLDRLARARPGPAKLVYLARAMVPGRFRVPGAVIEAPYRPEWRGEGQPQELLVLPPRAPARAAASR